MSSENINNAQNKISHNVCMQDALSGLTDCNEVDVHWSTRDARKSLCRMKAFEIYKKCMLDTAIRNNK
jgi:hypothetical protein